MKNNVTIQLKNNQNELDHYNIRKHNNGIHSVSLYRLIADFIANAHKKRFVSAEEYKECVNDIVNTPVVQEMKEYNHHSHTNCFEHSLHVSYYNYLICKKFGWDNRAAAKAGLLHDLFLYDWHKHKTGPGERMHGFEHPNKALKNARDHFSLTRKEGDIIVKHMFPLTITPPKYKESYVIVLTDKFCSVCEVMDRFFKKSKRDTFRKKKAMN